VAGFSAACGRGVSVTTQKFSTCSQLLKELLMHRKTIFLTGVLYGLRSRIMLFCELFGIGVTGSWLLAPVFGGSSGSCATCKTGYTPLHTLDYYEGMLSD
jgi:hypothetical protein